MIRSKQIRVAVVDDSSFIRLAIQRLLESDPVIRVVGLASSGEQLLENLDAWCPDVITLDLAMPGWGGLVTLDRIMERKRIPVIVLSSHTAENAALTIEALHRGAVDFIDKQQYSLVDFEALRAVLSEKLLHVVSAQPARYGKPDYSFMAEQDEDRERHFDALVMGASTGGPPAIQRILEDLGSQLPIPMAIVQHMPAGFTRALADRLNAHLPFPVREASHQEPFRAGFVYIAPANFHLKIKKDGDKEALVLSRRPEGVLHCPSVDVLFDSAAHCYGKRTLAVLLTGMGNDGAHGMELLKEAGAHTIAQDESSSVVYGMPRAAVEKGAAVEVLSDALIGQRLRHLLNPA